MNTKAFGELYQTVKAGVRAGAFPKTDPAKREALAGMFGAIKEIVKNKNKILDEQQVFLYDAFQVGTKGGVSMKNLVCYFRVSTKQQGASGLGLEAQKAAVDAFVKRTGGTVLKEFMEVESGKRADRPELAAALAFAKRAGAGLVVAKVDRLSRNVAFLSSLMESGVDFTACDMPEANRLTLHIMAAMAEHEREMISARTKAALAEVKKRGVALGSARPGHWEGREEARRAGGEKGLAKAHRVVSEKARSEYADLLPLIQAMRAEGLSMQKVADALNAAGHRTRRGKEFFASQVCNILKRAEGTI